MDGALVSEKVTVMENFQIVTLPTHISVFALFKANRGENTEEDGSKKLHDCLLLSSDSWLYDFLQRQCATVDLITSPAVFRLILTSNRFFKKPLLRLSGKKEKREMDDKQIQCFDIYDIYLMIYMYEYIFVYCEWRD